MENQEPIAYFITWTTYGTWLPGDARGWLKSGVLGVQEPNPALVAVSRQRMAESAVQLSPAQRDIVDKTIREHCQKRGWTLHALNVRPRHVHLVVTAALHDPDEVMNQCKAWTSRRLSDQAGLTKPVARKAGRRRWWTENGDKEKIYDEEHLHNAIAYVLEQQGD